MEVGRRWNSELGPGVVLLVAELCRGYRCGIGKGVSAQEQIFVFNYDTNITKKIL